MKPAKIAQSDGCDTLTDMRCLESKSGNLAVSGHHNEVRTKERIIYIMLNKISG